MIAAAVWLRDHAAEHGGDPDRLYLMGHSAGAHLAALAAVDAPRLARAGLTPSSFRGVVLLDGAGYDVRRQIEELGGARSEELYRTAFGQDSAVWDALSPTRRVTERTAPFLLLHVASREASRAQALRLAAALRAAGGEATVTPMDKTHATIYRDVGRDPTDPLTATILKFLAATRN